MEPEADIELDVSGLHCPMPLLKAKQALNKMAPGGVLKVLATDPASERDFHVFAVQGGIRLLDFRKEAGNFLYWLQKP